MIESVTPESSALLEAIIRDRQRRIWTHIPGKINKWNASTQRAEIQPLIEDVLVTVDGEELTTLPPIPNVPIKMPRAGGYIVWFPVKAGDTVELCFSARSLDQWLQKGGVVDPVLLHQHDLSDATATLGLYATPDQITMSNATKFVLGKIDDPSMQITIDGSSINLGDTAANYVALANLVANELGKIASALTGATAAGGGANLVFPGGAYVPGSVAATKVKAL